MTTKTFEDMLAEIRRQIEELEGQIEDLEARLDSDAAETQARLKGRIDRLREEEASAWAAVREKAVAVDDKVRQLEIDIAIAENRLASELAEDAQAFADAVEAELRHWDAAIERLQTRVATKAQEAREQAEAEIAALKQARNRAAERPHSAARVLGRRMAHAQGPCRSGARRSRAKGPRGGTEVPGRRDA